MPAINIVDKYQAIQYTGSNSADIDAAIAQLTIVSESGGVLTVESPPSGGTWVLNTGNWARFTQGSIYSTHTNTEFNNNYLHNAAFDDLNTTLQAAGIKQAPVILANSSATVAVDIIPSMPSSTYTAQAQLFTASLSSVSISSVSIVDSDTVNVTVQNNGLVSLSDVHVLVTVTP